jgi:hypothetical protein
MAKRLESGHDQFMAACNTAVRQRLAEHLAKLRAALVPQASNGTRPVVTIVISRPA